MIERHLPALGPHGFHRLAYVEWGGGGGRPVVCCHGLARCCRDFDRLAGALAAGRPVVCPDLPGRGHSDWLPAEDYGLPLYVADMAALLARLDCDEVDWVGTSLGGMIGMALAAQPNSPIRRLVLNDVGPFIPKASLLRIRGYVGNDPRFASLDEAEAAMRQDMTTFGRLSDADWRHLARHSVRPAGDGSLRLHYDPAIALSMKAKEPEDVEFWAVWEAVRCPVLVLRGAESDLLLRDTAAEMRRRGPGCELVEFPGVGHAPMLMDAGQIAPVVEWLRH